jgi:phosphatidylserine/phosphatidylglycerophosphate/cardiolipin synthase-like enzyme
MTIARNPKRNLAVTSENQVQAFISGAGQAVAAEPEQNKKPIMIRVDPGMIERIDRAAKRLGISRSAFIVSSAAVRLESME